MKNKDDHILDRVYNLILDPKISERERQLLVTFKEQVGKGAYFDRELAILSKGLQDLAIKNLQGEAGLSDDMKLFYQDISALSARKHAFRMGIANLGRL
ncbi:bacteriocin immunity protein [Streptococcus loxodontisalivarius]|uniref:Bacteriocin immunity protein n=1 Tax=Streptococcus loxodontisalivarius TaxID=1349415 RepID=A0ABS2PTB1_9STRE|nr:bacteriocin immunity protein [Streptococcus loxodontisalivarius]MBM7643259.1 hypothetical protein [Streptococcus loxodontisalivarius]